MNTGTVMQVSFSVDKARSVTASSGVAVRLVMI